MTGRDAPGDALRTDPEPVPTGFAGIAHLVRAHPWITAIMLACTIGGAAAGPFLMDETWTLARQIGAGGFLGAWVGLTITVTKMIG